MRVSDLNTLLFLLPWLVTAMARPMKPIGFGEGGSASRAASPVRSSPTTSPRTNVSQQEGHAVRHVAYVPPGGITRTPAGEMRVNYQVPRRSPSTSPERSASTSPGTPEWVRQAEQREAQSSKKGIFSKVGAKLKGAITGKGKKPKE